MSRQVFFYVEGPTEEALAKEVLVPHLTAAGLPCRGLVLAANGGGRGRVARGGLRTYAPVRRDVQRLLRQFNDPDLRFTTLLDLYGLPASFPMPPTPLPPAATGAEKARARAAAWKADISDSRFEPFFFAHEFEALLLSDPDCLLVAFPRAQNAVRRLKNEIAGFAGPEDINDTPSKAPSRRIRDCIPEFGYEKAFAGILGILEIGLPRIRTKCPHFDAWLRDLEAFGDPIHE